MNAGEPHDYLSTGCLHGRHDYCQNREGQAGSKTPATCKFCEAKCTCPCHQGGAAPENTRPVDLMELLPPPPGEEDS
ncbi:hypothetical protein STBA_10820 [Streptomyces sp. MP131-18]|nr:hypothetical protein STBA_10820 [Streptomyces sp. MP131-18]